VADLSGSQLELEADAAQELQELVASLSASQLAERLLRLERSLLRLEHMNAATMNLLRQLVQAARISGNKDGLTS
jgi:hypothetical protein